MKSIEEIYKYLDEALDKSWYYGIWKGDKDIAIYDGKDRDAARNTFRKIADTILKTYPELPDKPFQNYETLDDDYFRHGWWHGVMAALHWVLS